MTKHFAGFLIGMTALAAGLHAAPALAAPELIANGGFATTSATSSQQITTTNVANWSSTGYNFIYLPDASTASGTSADTSGATGSYGNVKLWGAGDGSVNGLSVSPAGGSFVAADGNFGQGAISQTVSNLTVGQTYNLQFYWAAAQQYGYDGTNQEQWQVTFGNQVQSTSPIVLAAHAFSGWTLATMNFVASASSQTLSFLAVSGPNGNPPFSLLDGVSLMAVSEPGSLTLLGVGVACLLGWTVSRRRRAV